jgi:hypothetical protein
MKLSTFFFIISMSISFHKSAGDDSKLSEDLQKDLEEISLTKRRAKLAACMSIIRNSLAEGNSDIKSTLESSNFDRSKSFDKIVLSMVNNCDEHIKPADIEYVLSPDNVLTPLVSKAELKSLIKFNKDILSVDLSEREQQIQKEMNEALFTLDTDLTTQDDEVGFIGVKLSQLGHWNWFFVGLGVLLAVTVVFGGLYIVLKKKPQKKKDRKTK